MKAEIYCEVKNSRHFFYLKINKETYYLFSQAYRRGVDKYFRYGVTLNRAINFDGTNGDHSLLATKEKILPSIRYIEKEYDVGILQSTKNKNRNCNYTRRQPYKRQKFEISKLIFEEIGA